MERGDAERDGALTWTCLGAVVAWLIALAVRFPHGDGDLLWQRWLGARILREHAIPRVLGTETFAAAGAPWTPHEWLFSVALSWTNDHACGWVVPLACALAAGGALATVIARCRARSVSSAFASAGVLLCTFAMMQSFGTRAQVLGWSALAVFVYLLEIEGPWMWAAIPLTVVWANVHASVMLAPAVAATFALAALLRDRTISPSVRRFATLTVACSVGMLLTPLGADLPRYAVALLASPIRASISEWGATSVASVGFAIGALPLLVTLAIFGVRASLRDRLLALAFTIMLFTAVRNVPVFALVVAPIALATVPFRRATSAFAPALRLGSILAVASCGVVITTLTWRSSPPPESVLPFETSRALLARAQTAPRVFCEDFAWCSVFLGASARFFMDGRCDPYPPSVWREYRRVIDGNRGWDEVLDRYGVDAVLVRRDSALDSLLAERRPVWRALAVKGPARLYVRPAVLALGR